jgi:putative cell wall-binding protein
MPSSPPRPLGSRGRLVAALTVASLLLAAPSALADPAAPDALAGPEGTDPLPQGVVSQGEHGDHFDEGVAPEGEAFVLKVDATGKTALTSADEVPVEPMAWEGPAPDPADIPEEWLRPTPAEEIEPSTPEELMSADTGYLAQFGPRARDTASTQAEGDPDAVPSPPTKTLPPVLDAAPGWQYTYSCDPNNKPGMLKFAQLVSSHYKKPSYFTWRHCIAGDNSQHYEGRAFDWGMNAYDPKDKAIGDAVAQWLTANNGEMARRFGVMSVIWNRRSWYLYDPGSWRTYTGPNPHTDHLHISFTWDGAMGRTSWWTGTPVTVVDHGTCRVYAGQYAPRYTGRRTSPCPTSLPQPPASPYPVYLPQARHDHIKIAQQHLGFTGADVDGIFGPMTLAALLDYQRTRGLPVTGVLDNATWARMLAPGGTVTRVHGANRYETAAALSQGFPTRGDVFVTSGQDFPDALAASARAGVLGAPVLLTQKGRVPAATRDALSRLAPKRIFVVGGPGAVTEDVLGELRATGATVTRIGGANRYATAGLLARQFGSQVPVVYVATAADFPDAMAGAARAAYNQGPILLTRRDSVPAETLAAIQAISPWRVVVLGGTGSVSEPVAQQLKRLTRGQILERVAGANRYDTAARLAGYYPTTTSTVYVATGQGFPDALAGSAAAAAARGPMLLTSSTSLPTTTANAVARLQPSKVVVVGGGTVVSSKVVNQLRAIVD